MELPSKDVSVTKGASMGFKQLSERYTGEDYVQYCTLALAIKPTMLAAILSVTERTLSNWAETHITADSQGKIDRLKTLFKIISIAEAKGVRGKLILNVLNEPIPGEAGDKSLLHFVVDEPNNSLLDAVVLRVLDSFN